MGKSCIICKNVGDSKERRGLHRFPKDSNLRKKWVDVLGEENVSHYESADQRICSDHFAQADILEKPSGIIYLRKGAVPVRNLIRDEDYEYITIQVGQSSEACTSPVNRVEILVVPTSISSAPQPSSSRSTITASESALSATLNSPDSDDLNNFTDAALEHSSGLENLEVVQRQREPRNSNMFSTSTDFSLQTNLNKQSLKQRKVVRKQKYFGGMESGDMASTRRAIHAWNEYKKTIARQRRQIKSLTLVKMRLKNKLYNLISLITYMKKR